MNSESWDWEAQRAETAEQIKAMAHPWVDATTEIIITIRTEPAEDAEFENPAYLDALTAAGFQAEEDDYDEEIVWVTAKATSSLEGVWAVERRVTEIALAHDFRPAEWEQLDPSYP